MSIKSDGLAIHFRPNTIWNNETRCPTKQAGWSTELYIIYCIRIKGASHFLYHCVSLGTYLVPSSKNTDKNGNPTSSPPLPQILNFFNHPSPKTFNSLLVLQLPNWSQLDTENMRMWQYTLLIEHYHLDETSLLK